MPDPISRPYPRTECAIHVPAPDWSACPPYLSLTPGTAVPAERTKPQDDDQGGTRGT